MNGESECYGRSIVRDARGGELSFFLKAVQSTMHCALGERGVEKAHQQVNIWISLPVIL